LCGCAGVRLPSPSTRDVKVEHAQRKEDIVRDFEIHRDQAQYQAALGRFRAGDIKGCRQLVDQLLARRPKNADARLLLAELLYDTDPAASRQHIERAAADDPNNAQAHHSLALLLDADGKHDEAKVHFDRARQLEPHNEVYADDPEEDGYDNMEFAGAPDGPGSLQRQMPPARTGPPAADAKKVGYGNIVKVSSQSGFANMLEDADHALAMGDEQKARDRLAPLMDRTPDDAQVVMDAALLALRYEKPQLAVDVLLLAATRPNPSAAMCRTLGTAYYRLGQYERAKTLLEQALSLDNTHALSYFLMGSTLEKLGQRDGAEEYYRQAGRRDPRFANHQ